MRDSLSSVDPFCHASVTHRLVQPRLRRAQSLCTACTAPCRCAFFAHNRRSPVGDSSKHLSTRQRSNMEKNEARDEGKAMKRVKGGTSRSKEMSLRAGG
ncbi:hypothetical protein SESBI_50061 [Sesbania bispinosa]|nr:hypothetical protein SESBI_50061 [Sesbania bispinosa]